MLYKIVINKIFRTLFVLLFSVWAITASAVETEGVNDYAHLSDEQFETLMMIKQFFTTIEQFQKQGKLSKQQAEGARAYILLQQQSEMDEPLAQATLQKLVMSCMQDKQCREKSIMSRFSGLFNFVNIMWFFASVLILIGFVAVLSVYKHFILRLLRPVTGFLHSVFSVVLPIIARFFRRIPILLYEFIALFIAFMVIYVARFASEPSQVFIAFMGNVLVMLILAYLYRTHREAIGDFYIKHSSLLRHKPKSLLMSVSCMVWAFSAIYYQSQLLGFFSIAILLTWLGFGIAITSLEYSFGFHGRKSIVNGTKGAFLLLAVYVYITIMQLHVPYYTNFETGIKYLGSFVFYIGLLISSNKWVCQYYKFDYLVLQLLTIICGIAAVYIGSVFDMSVLRGIGGTFFVMYIIEKQFEFPWNKKRFAWLLLLLGLSLYAIAHIVSVYPEFFFMSAIVE